MAKDLTESPHDRQNILNNRYALQQAEQLLGLGGVVFGGAGVECGGDCGGNSKTFGKGLSKKIS